jgi:hypothetical protein
LADRAHAIFFKQTNFTGLSVGDIVFIAGEEKDGIIQAFGVKKEGERKRGPRPIDE